MMVITKTELALEQNLFSQIYVLIFCFSFDRGFFSPNLHLVYSFIEIPESHSLCLIS